MIEFVQMVNLLDLFETLSVVMTITIMTTTREDDGTWF